MEEGEEGSRHENPDVFGSYLKGSTAKCGAITSSRRSGTQSERDNEGIMGRMTEVERVTTRHHQHS